MSYFRELPDLEYQSPLSNRVSSKTYMRAKNIFRRMKIRDDLQNIFTVFNKYVIKDGARPDTVAEELYGSSTLDWVVTISAGIVNIKNEWPLSSKDIYNFSEEKYGLSGLNDTHHYETKEIKNSSGNIVLPKGKVVDSDYTIRYFDNGVEKSSTIPDTVVGVTNYEYETEENLKKQNIYVLKKRYLQQFMIDMKNEMTYKKSSQYVNDKLIRTENTRITI